MPELGTAELDEARGPPLVVGGGALGREIAWARHRGGRGGAGEPVDLVAPQVAMAVASKPYWHLAKSATSEDGW